MHSKSFGGVIVQVHGRKMTGQDLCQPATVTQDSYGGSFVYSVLWISVCWQAQEMNHHFDVFKKRNAL